MHDVTREVLFGQSVWCMVKVNLIFSCMRVNFSSLNSLHSRISIICEYAYIAFCFPSRRPVFAVLPFKVYFSGYQFQNRTYNKSLET